MELANPLHLALLLVVLLLVFGAKRLPEMGRGLGDGMRSFRDAVSGNSPAAAPAQLTGDTAVDTSAPAPVASLAAVPADVA